MRLSISSPLDVITLSDRYDDPTHVWAIKKDGVSGLFGTPSTRETPIDKPQMDGAYWPSRLTQNSRTISLDCFMRCASTLDAALARDRINALTCQPLTLCVEDVTGVRMIDCYLAADPEPLMRYRRSAFEFGLVLSCPDPYWYGAWEWQQAPTDGQVHINNTGTAPTWIQVRTSSNMTRFTLTYTDAKIQWAGNTTQFLVHTRDMIPSHGQILVDLAKPIQPGITPLHVQTDCTTLMIGVRPAWR